MTPLEGLRHPSILGNDSMMNQHYFDRVGAQRRQRDDEQGPPGSAAEAQSRIMTRANEGMSDAASGGYNRQWLPFLEQDYVKGEEDPEGRKFRTNFGSLGQGTGALPRTRGIPQPAAPPSPWSQGAPQNPWSVGQPVKPWGLG